MTIVQAHIYKETVLHAPFM